MWNTWITGEARTFHLGGLQRLPRGTSEKLRPEEGIWKRTWFREWCCRQRDRQKPRGKRAPMHIAASEKVRMAARGGVRCWGWGEQDTWQAQRD